MNGGAFGAPLLGSALVVHCLTRQLLLFLIKAIRWYYEYHLRWLINDAILPAIFHLLARSAGATTGFAFDCFVKLIAATIAAARRASSPSFCAASLAFRRSRNLAM